MSADEFALIASIQGGNLEDFDPLYRRYINQIFAFTYRRTMNKATAEDLTSVTFMKALEKIDTYSPTKGPFVAWLYRIGRNTITDHYRQQRDVKDIEDVWDLSSDEDVLLTVDDRLTYEKLQDAMRTLPALKRDIILMRLWDGLSYREIAEITGKTENNLKVMYSRTIAELKLQVPLATVLLLLLSPTLR